MPFKLLNLGRTLLCLVSNDAYFQALSSGTNNSKTRTYDPFTRERRIEQHEWHLTCNNAGVTIPQSLLLGTGLIESNSR